MITRWNTSWPGTAASPRSGPPSSSEPWAIIRRCSGSWWSTVVFWPLLFLFKGVRTSPGWLFASGIIINIGMWLERFVIIIGPVSHDFDPYSWGTYWPSWVEWGILYGSFSALAFGFLLFTKYLPTIPITEIKEDLEPPPCGPDHG